MSARDPKALSRVIKAYDVRGVVGEEIDGPLVRDIGAAFARLLRGEGETAVAVGHDMRDSSPGFARSFAEGVAAQGLDVILLGLTSTDELYYAAGALGHAGAMFTASHNPARYNGIKLCRRGARPVGRESGLAEITAALVDGVPAHDGPVGGISSRDVLAEYARHLHSLVDLSGIRPLRVAVDAANGMAGLTVPAVLDIPAVDLRPLYFELDGTFPNHEANPLEPANLADLRRFTREQGADIGLAFDGDADRCFVVDECGEPVSPSDICALIADRHLAGHPGATIIHNLITSAAVPELIRAEGGTAERTRVGHSFIKARMAETGAVFGGEHSAHYYFRDFFNADSGILAAMHVLAALGSGSAPLSELMAGYHRYESSGEINSTVSDPEAATRRVLEAFADRTAEVDHLDGVTVRLAGTPAWFNVRASNTEPLLRLNVEAPGRDEVDAIVAEALAAIRA